ncbi:E3 ubiquitin-protein ligase RNF12-like isoform X1 [Mya arenaria]|uniref:E3 ubiquitin-protein ligase RNF12-like isoform X1 n=2 Tax=Mya arenaria TaxID=6604 RepID=UPI0022E73642|nr:E3 ubiquitin-protein ligase RNF12-like isoform X1 [Mya arenaria]
MGKISSKHKRKQNQAPRTNDELLYSSSHPERTREPSVELSTSENNSQPASSEMNTLENNSQLASSEMNTLENNSQLASSEMNTLENNSQPASSEMNTLENNSQLASSEMNTLGINSQDTDRLQPFVLGTSSLLNERYILSKVPLGNEDDEVLNIPNDNNYTPEGSVSADSSAFSLRPVTCPKDDPLYFYPSGIALVDSESEDESVHEQNDVLHYFEHDEDEINIYGDYLEQDSDNLDDRGLSVEALGRLPIKYARATLDVCHVCFENYEVGDLQKVLPCFHLFHSSCIDQWLQESATCPVCRTHVDIEDY